MKKLFGREKPRISKVTSVPRDPNAPAILPGEDQHPNYHQQVVGGAAILEPSLRRSSSDDRWEVIPALTDSSLQAPHPPALAASRSSSVASLPPGASPPIPSPLATGPRASSPFGIATHHSGHSSRTGNQRAGERDRVDAPAPRKKVVGSVGGVAALGILRALEPQIPHPDTISSDTNEHSEDMPPPPSSGETLNRDDKKDKKGFWERSGMRELREKEKEKEKEKDRWKERDRRDGDGQAELTRMIGYLTATASEDWSLVLEVCERASSNDTNAKDAVRALRREFKYAEPPAQLSAARLWAIMLRNSSDVFISQNTSRKFLDTLEDVLTSSRTSPVVKERLLDVLAAAAFASGSKSRTDKDGFRGLWRRIKPPGAPEEGIPFDTEDAMFNPPMPRVLNQNANDASTFSGNLYQRQSSPSRDRVKPTAKRKSSFSRNRIIPVEEDIRRLFQECKIGQGNAGLLSEALAFARPEDLTKKEIIREFYVKCRASQELIYAQIPWASAGAERSRLASGRPGQNKLLSRGTDSNASLTSFAPDADETYSELTVEEQLLAALLGANEDLLEALRVYDDLERVAVEKEAEDISRKETKIDRSQLHHEESSFHRGQSSSRWGSSSSSRSPSPSPSTSPDLPSTAPSQAHPLPRIPPSLMPSHPTNLNSTQVSAAQLAALAQSLAPPPPAPQGPRSPAQLSLTSRTPSPASGGHSRQNSLDSLEGDLRDRLDRLRVGDSELIIEEDIMVPIKPSAKALGKRKIVEAGDPDQLYGSDDAFFEHKEEPTQRSEDRIDSDSDDGHHTRWNQPVKYVYDAAQEIRQQRLREGRTLVNGVH